MKIAPLKMASGASYKHPPALGEETQYESWVKEVKLWSLCCKLTNEEQGPALALSLKGNARQAAMDLDLPTLNSAAGLQAVINKLNGLYLKDVNQWIYVALKSFEHFKREESSSMDDYLNEFDIKYSKLKSHGIVLPDVVLGYRMIESANLSKSRSELVRISATQMTYDEIKTQLRKLEDIAVSSSENYTSTSQTLIKTEESDAFYSQSENNDFSDVLYNRSSEHQRGAYRSRGGRGGRGGRSRGGGRGNFHGDNGGRSVHFQNNNHVRGRGGGYRGRGRGVCHVCFSPQHYARDCPSNENNGNQTDGVEVEDVEIVNIEI